MMGSRINVHPGADLQVEISGVVNARLGRPRRVARP